MSRVLATILHISDLHFGRRVFRRQISRDFSSALRDMISPRKACSEAAEAEAADDKKTIYPDYIIVSGDLAEHPSPWAMKQAFKYLCEIAQKAQLPPDRLLIIPGNHDYKIMGNFGLRRLSRIPFEIYFRKEWDESAGWETRIEWLKEKRGERWAEYLKLTADALWPRGKRLADRLETIIDPNGKIAIFGMNSTPLFQPFGFATGKVEGKQLRALMSEMEKNSDRVGDALKIVVVHHHPLPVSYDRTNGQSRFEESFMVFYNAGGFLRQLSREGVDLILHGHKHQSNFVRVTYDFENGMRHTMAVLAAGSATHKKPSDPLGNQFNIIRVYDDDTVKIERRYFTDDGVRKEESSEHDLYTLNDVRVRRTIRHQRIAGLSIGKVSKFVYLTHDGYSRVEVFVQDCRVLSNTGSNAYKFEDIEVERPAYIRDPKILRWGQMPGFTRMAIDDNNSHFRCIKGQITFGTTHTKEYGSFDVGYTYRLMNGHSLSLREFQRRYFGEKHKNRKWEFSSRACERATDILKLVVQFPEDFDMESIVEYDAVAVYIPSTSGKEKQIHTQETTRIKGKVRLHEKRLSLEVALPVPGFIYRIRWSYKDDSAAPRPSVQEETLRDARKRLLDIARNMGPGGESSSVYQRILGLLNSFLQDISRRYEEIYKDEKLNISLSIFDDQDSVLRFAAANFGSITKLFKEAMMPGEGCQGFAFEKGSVVFYNRTRDKLGYYIQPHEMEIELKKACEGETDQKPSSEIIQSEVMVAIPWISDSEIPMGVVNISSDSNASRLLHLLDMSDDEKTEEENVLKLLTRTLGSAIIAVLTAGKH